MEWNKNQDSLNLRHSLWTFFIAALATSQRNRIVVNSSISEMTSSGFSPPEAKSLKISEHLNQSEKFQMTTPTTHSAHKNIGNRIKFFSKTPRNYEMMRINNVTIQIRFPCKTCYQLLACCCCWVSKTRFLSVQN